MKKMLERAVAYAANAIPLLCVVDIFLHNTISSLLRLGEGWGFSIRIIFNYGHFLNPNE